jgi:hypothetical protein
VADDYTSADNEAAYQKMTQAQSDADARAEVTSYQPPETTPHPMASAPPNPLQAAQVTPPATTTPSFLDSVLSTTDSYLSHFGKYAADTTRDVASGLATGIVNTADAAKSFIGQSGKGLAMAEDPANGPQNNGKSDDQNQREADAADPITPMYNDARQAALGVRDAIAIKDPNIADHLLEGAGQFLPSFLMFSRVIGSIGGLAQLGEGADGLAGVATRFAAKSAVTASSDAAAASTVMAPHDPRMADTFSLMRTSEGKFGDLLRAAAPDGSLLNGYINYISDHTDETEAQGRWKNVLDNANIAAALSGVIHTGGSVLKQGWNALHFMADNNMGSMSDLMPAPQEGKIGYHGTPHEIDPAVGFDDSKIGTGEGAQAYGYGHYIAESPEVAGKYQARLGAQATPALQIAKSALDAAGGDPVKAYKTLAAKLPGDGIGDVAKARELLKSGNVNAGAGNKYTVDIADEKIDAMIDHDKPLAEQPEVAKVFQSYGIDDPSMTGGDAYKMLSSKLTPEAPEEAPGTPRGWGYYQRGNEGDPRASAVLNLRGIPGIKYLDGGSRGTGDGTRNFVMFNGKDAKITEKNGKPVATQDMTLSKEERALERERVAAQRQREDGITPEHEPEPIPRRAAEHEGVVARRMQEK